MQSKKFHQSLPILALELALLPPRTSPLEVENHQSENLFTTFYSFTQ